MTENKSTSWQMALVAGVGERLPVQLRAAYFDLWRYFQAIPADDEILKVLNAMQFLTFIMKEVPERVIVERKSLEQLFADGLQEMRAMFEASNRYHQQLDRRLTQLPEAIAKEISPEAIAVSINESLRQQFVRSTIPQSAEALGRISAEMKNVVAEFARTAASLGKAYSGAAADARHAVDEIQSSVSRAADSARRATEKLSTTFHREYRWSLYTLSGFGLIVGLAFGMLLEAWFNPPQRRLVRDPIEVSRPAPEVEIPVPMPVPKKKR